MESIELLRLDTVRGNYEHCDQAVLLSTAREQAE